LSAFFFSLLLFPHIAVSLKHDYPLQISGSVPFDDSSLSIVGFVEELIVEDDPEYRWVDNFRASRISNEERQRLLYTLSGYSCKRRKKKTLFVTCRCRRIRRQLGKKVLDLGADAVFGYHQSFDLEGESGIIVRGCGTAVKLKRPQIVREKSKKKGIQFNLQFFLFFRNTSYLSTCPHLGRLLHLVQSPTLARALFPILQTI
jgi:hypothetical protein